MRLIQLIRVTIRVRVRVRVGVRVRIRVVVRTRVSVTKHSFAAQQYITTKLTEWDRGTHMRQW